MEERGRGGNKTSKSSWQNEACIFDYVEKCTIKPSFCSVRNCKLKLPGSSNNLEISDFFLHLKLLPRFRLLLSLRKKLGRPSSNIPKTLFSKRSQEAGALHDRIFRNFEASKSAGFLKLLNCERVGLAWIRSHILNLAQSSVNDCGPKYLQPDRSYHSERSTNPTQLRNEDQSRIAKCSVGSQLSALSIERNPRVSRL